jgi:virginiamycin A acetyltransferase
MFRQAMKSLIYCIGWIVTAPLWLVERVSRRIAGRDVWFVTQSEILSLLPGKLGRLLRNAYYSVTLESCPLHMCLQFGCLFAYSQVRLGQNVYLGLHSKVGLVHIGDDTIISDDVQLLSGAHQHSAAESSGGVHFHSPNPERITIGRNCWIGARAIVMADIGENCIIGAGAVVTRPVPPNSVAVGVPARVIKSLTIDAEIIRDTIDLGQDLTAAAS